MQNALVFLYSSLVIYSSSKQHYHKKT